jgi:hypothetical protein
MFVFSVRYEINIYIWYRVFVGKRGEKRPLWSPRFTFRWEDNVKMDLQEMECDGMDWIRLS